MNKLKLTLEQIRSEFLERITMNSNGVEKSPVSLELTFELLNLYVTQVNNTDERKLITYIDNLIDRLLENSSFDLTISYDFLLFLRKHSLLSL